VENNERREMKRNVPIAMGIAMVYFGFTDLGVDEQIAQQYIQMDYLLVLSGNMFELIINVIK